LFLLPLASLILVPCGWVYAFYESVSVMDDGRMNFRELFGASVRQSGLWVAQNHIILLTCGGFGMFVFFNWASLIFAAPQLLHMLLGIESAFSQSPLSMLNTTFLAITCALTFLTVDPLLKACYVLRCFYGHSLRSGDDLKTELRSLSRPALAVLALLTLGLAAPAAKAGGTIPEPTPAVSSQELDQSIARVIQQPKYTWRTPREKAATEAKENPFRGFLKSVFSMAKSAGKAMIKFLRKILAPLLRRHPAEQGGWNWLTPELGLLFGILAAAACIFAVAAIRIARARRRTGTAQVTATASTPDLEDEKTTADELPEDDWSRLGRRYLEQGDFRVALRAFYLATLAHLAARGLLTITRSKSNRDYERELRRRGHAIANLPALFGENVGIFDRAWYGLYEVDADVVEHFLGNLERMKGAA